MAHLPLPLNSLQLLLLVVLQINVKVLIQLKLEKLLFDCSINLLELRFVETDNIVIIILQPIDRFHLYGVAENAAGNFKTLKVFGSSKLRRHHGSAERHRISQKVLLLVVNL